MNKYDENYSSYYIGPNDDYPLGGAKPASNKKQYDGTPLRSLFMNDVLGFFQAAFFGVFGNTREVSGESETARKSDVWDAIKKFATDKADSVKTALDNFIATKGTANGLAPLDASGKVSSTYLPSYVDDVLEYTNRAAFPSTGETGKIYVAKDSNKSYRWSGSTYIELSKYNDATTTASGLMSAADKEKLDGIEDNANDYVHPTYTARTGKPEADATPGFGETVTVSQVESDGEGHVTGMTDRTITIPDTAMVGATATKDGEKGLVPAPAKNENYSFLRGDGTWSMPPAAEVDFYLNDTSGNAIANNVVTANIGCAICGNMTYYYDDDESVAYAYCNLSIEGFALRAGATIKVMFIVSNTSSSRIIDGGVVLRINGGVAKSIKAVLNGEKKDITTTYVDAVYKLWQKYTTLELMYDGTDWIIMGNPVLLAKFGTESGYEKRANGLITQWGSVTLSDYKGAGDMEIVFGISFSNTRYAFTLMGIHSTFYTSTEEWAEEEWTKKKSRVSYTKRQRDYPLYKEFDWTAIGY